METYTVKVCMKSAVFHKSESKKRSVRGELRKTTKITCQEKKEYDTVLSSTIGGELTRFP